MQEFKEKTRDERIREIINSALSETEVEYLVG